jgi:hypothetical protein
MAARLRFMEPDLRVCRDEDCPGCGWPETVAVGRDWKAGPTRIECGRQTPCGWSVPVAGEEKARA